MDDLDGMFDPDFNLLPQVLELLGRYELIRGRGSALLIAICDRAHQPGPTRDWPGMIAVGVDESLSPFTADMLLQVLAEHERQFHAVDHQQQAGPRG